MSKKLFALWIIGLFSGLAPTQQAWSTSINFDDAGLTHLSDITNFYAGVQFNAIDNMIPIGAGPYPAPATVPTIIGGAGIWDPLGSTAPGESPPNFAVGTCDSCDPGDPGILMTFDTPISGLSLVGLDFGNTATDTEGMTLTAYDSAGNLIGQSHFTAQFTEGAIMGSLGFGNMKYVAFNYTDTAFGFYGIDDLEFTTVIPVPAAVWLFGSGLIGLISIARRKKE